MRERDGDEGLASVSSYLSHCIGSPRQTDMHTNNLLMGHESASGVV